MQLEDIKLFIWAAQLQSFTLTAKHFSMTKQKVSRRIDGLEKQLGVRLLQRTTRKIELTDLGRKYLERWVKILDDIECTEQMITDYQTEPKGRVRIGAPGDFSRELLSHILPELTERFPELEIMLHSTEGNLQRPDLNLDLLIHIGRPKDSAFVGSSLGTLHRKFYASPEYIAEHGQPAHPRELEKHTCLLNPVMGAPADVWQWCEVSEDGRSYEEHNVRISGRLGADTCCFAKRMARGGAGIAWLPEFLARRAVAEGQLVELFGGQYGKPYEMVVLYASRSFMPARTRAVLDYLHERLKNQLDLDQLRGD